MAQTPATSRLTSGRQTGSQPGQGINNVDQVAPGGYNGFDKPWSNFITPRFAEITPFFYTDTVGKSKELLVNTHQVRAYTMSAPNMQEIRMHKSYYSVPKEAIMPNTWEYWFKNPKHGDDVPPNSCYPGCTKGLLYKNLEWADNPFSSGDTSSLDFDDVASFLHYIGLISLFCSRDSLLAHLGSPLVSPHVIVSQSPYDDTNLILNGDIDDFLDWMINYIASKQSSMTNSFTIVDGYGYRKSFWSESKLSDIREVILTYITDSDYTIPSSYRGGIVDFFKTIFNEFKFFFLVQAYYPDLFDSKDFISFDMAKAYQMTCVQFFSNSDVDDIYTYKMWEDNSLALFVKNQTVLPTYGISFDYNGSSVLYDSYAQAQCDYLLGLDFTTTRLNDIFKVFSNLLCFRRSLIYRDYFYGARLSPLAVGDVNVSINEDKVSAIDITKNIVKQRFLNAVNKVPGDILSYLKGIFGYEPIRIPPQPIFLAEDTFTVTGELVANTSNDNQGRLVQNISFRDADRGYEVYNDCESFIFGFVWFDYVPAYTNATDRLRLMNDRFDFFQPFMQTIGDQPVLASEADNEASSDETISWQIRNMEYKQRFSKKVGGFVKDLPNWTLETKSLPKVLSPNAIRNENKDIDSLYSKISGCSPANYFHFIMSNHNSQISNLPMLRQPGIL